MLIVKKFGGSSVANKDRIFNVAKRCIEDYKAGHDVVVVLSAMGDTTDELIALANTINPDAKKRELDMLLLGDGTAENLGVNVTRIKMVVIIMAAVLTGIVVSVSGVIGFIGLVVPHIARRMVGSRHTIVLPFVIVLGGLFTVLADFLSRVIVAPEELPIGIIAALSGAPFFLYLIRRGRRKST